MPLGGSTSDFRPFRYRLAQKGNSRSIVNSLGGDSVEDIKSSIRAYGWSQNISKKLYVMFQVKLTMFDPLSTLEQQNQASRHARTTADITHQTKHMSGFNMLPKGYMSSFRSFWQHLTRLWCSEAKLDLPEADLLGTMTSKSELMDFLKMTPISSLSNFRSIGHRLTVYQSAASSPRQNQVSWRRDPTQLQNSNKILWLVLSIAQEAPRQISGHSNIVWPSFGF